MPNYCNLSHFLHPAHLKLVRTTACIGGGGRAGQVKLFLNRQLLFYRISVCPSRDNNEQTPKIKLSPMPQITELIIPGFEEVSKEQLS